MNSNTRKYLFIALFVAASLLTIYFVYSLVAFGSPLSKTMRQHLVNGNEFHKDSLFNKAAESYFKSEALDKDNPVANYNLATNIAVKNNALPKEDRNNDVVIDDYLYADTVFTQVIAKDTVKANVANSWRNMGVMYHRIANDKELDTLLVQKIDSIAKNNPDADVDGYTPGGDRYSLLKAKKAYENSLRIDPGNEETRYNLAVVNYLLKKEQQQRQNQQQNQQQQQNNQQQQQNNQQEQQEQQQEQQQQQQQQQQQEKQEKSERNLESIMQNEQQVRRKVNEGEERKPGSKKYFENNW